MLSCKPLYFAFSEAICKKLRHSGVSMPLHFLSTLYMQATLAVYTSESIGSSEGYSVSFPWCFMRRSTSVIQYSQRPVATMSA
jgi:hypothetical protein